MYQFEVTWRTGMMTVSEIRSDKKQLSPVNLLKTTSPLVIWGTRSVTRRCGRAIFAVQSEHFFLTLKISILIRCNVSWQVTHTSLFLWIFTAQGGARLHLSLWRWIIPHLPPWSFRRKNLVWGNCFYDKSFTAHQVWRIDKTVHKCTVHNIILM